MTDNYQLAEKAIQFVYEIDTDSDSGDPAGANGGRFDLPGATLDIPSLTETYGNKDWTPVGAGPGILLSSRTTAEFEIEVGHWLSKAFSAITGDEFISLSLGTIDSITGLVTLDRPLRNFTSEYGHSDPSPWFNLLEHCKINTYSLAFRPDDFILGRAGIIPRKYTKSVAPVDTGLGTDADAVPVTSDVGARFKDVTFTFRTVPAGTLIPVNVTEFDLSWTNNLQGIRSDNQDFIFSHLREALRRFTFNFTTLKQDDQLWDISQNDPATDAGKLDLEIIIDQPSGFYARFDFPFCTIGEHDAPIGQDVPVVMESFAGSVIGDPVIDFNK